MLRRCGERVYAYRSFRQGGRVATEYLGAGPVAEAVETLDRIDRDDRRLEREARRRAVAALVKDWAKLGRDVARLGGRVDRSFRAAMGLCGYHLHNRGWRRRG